MIIKAKTPEDYINQIPDERKPAIEKLRQVILQNLPKGYEETISYDMIAYVIPHSLYPPGYHVNPKIPLPFINIASQKNFIAFYHMGLYANRDLLEWFKSEYPKYSKTKPDMGKICVRFKNIENIPYDLIAELVKKISPEAYIKFYETILHRTKDK
ncbi:MAG: DUF1801 domain-containing protein [Bacteroidales bacterium]|nr:DUF1801 domain-containing protein [Bacteroidales bacterium]